MRIGGHRALLDQQLSHNALGGLNQGSLQLFGEVEIPRDASETMHAIMQRDGDSPHVLHRIVADAKQREHEIHLLHSDWILLVDVIESDGGDYENGQHEQRDVVERSKRVEERVIVVLLYEEVVVLLGEEVLPAYELGLSHLVK